MTKLAAGTIASSAWALCGMYPESLTPAVSCCSFTCVACCVLTMMTMRRQCEVPFKMWFLFAEKRRKERETRDRLVRTLRRIKVRKLMSKIMRYWRHQVNGEDANDKTGRCTEDRGEMTDREECSIPSKYRRSVCFLGGRRKGRVGLSLSLSCRQIDVMLHDGGVMVLGLQRVCCVWWSVMTRTMQTVVAHHN
jgi:hypothetical protein